MCDIFVTALILICKLVICLVAVSYILYSGGLVFVIPFYAGVWLVIRVCSGLKWFLDAVKAKGGIS